MADFTVLGTVPLTSFKCYKSRQDLEPSITLHLEIFLYDFFESVSTSCDLWSRRWIVG